MRTRERFGGKVLLAKSLSKIRSRWDRNYPILILVGNETGQKNRG